MQKKLKFATALLVTAAWCSSATAQQGPTGIFEDHGDVGAVKVAGSAAYDTDLQEYRIAGSGTNIWFDRDEFHFVWKRLKGDFIVRARVGFVGQGVQPHRKIGWMVRSSLETDSPHVSAAVHGDGLTSLQFRPAAGAQTEEIRSPVQGAEILQLQRKGDAYTMSAARFGEPFKAESATEAELGDEVYVGLFVCSHDPDVLERALFQNVRIVAPAKEDLVPYRDYIGSNLEILDVESGRRLIVHRTDDSMQAPNWTPDGRTLIYNRNGLLYRFDLKAKQPEVLNTGFATANNNDHVLSFDGSMLGISHHSETDDGNSIIYTLPAGGGEPRRVTSKGPSYLHGWSPDGKTLTYTGIRDGAADIYSISAQGGEETRLTDAEGLDDGSEYSPDGEYIYFNSVRSGSMEIWRMRPDGGGAEQITDDEYNNWFPHISPDGEWIAFLSYLPDVDPGDHPFYQRVYLRLMPAGGGSARVIAYVYGGQGTINVPSWAPNSKRLAFVSNTDVH